MQKTLTVPFKSMEAADNFRLTLARSAFYTDVHVYETDKGWIVKAEKQRVQQKDLFTKQLGLV